MAPIVVLMNGSLRLDDHPALAIAAASGRPVVPVYVQDDASAGRWALGAARRWWVLQSLKALGQGVEKLGGKLTLRVGATSEELARVIEECGASAVYLTRSYHPSGRKTEEVVRLLCEIANIECRRFGGNLLLEPEVPKTKAGKPYEVFSPFWRAALAFINAAEPALAPQRLKAPDRWPASCSIDDLSLAPSPAHWVEPIAAAWAPGEAAAQRKLADFLAGPIHYKVARDHPALEATSRLSPYLANGEIGPGRIWYEAKKAASINPEVTSCIDWFLRELGWREFSAHLLYHFPQIPDRPLKDRFEKFPWQRGNDPLVRGWQQGLTGFPIIDAGMRQLWKTGWMHNRVRMIVASFLVKDLLWSWQDGQDWFWDTLVDADLANNAASWQWVAGCGADAAPYFRIFNPILQGEKFDKQGDYVRMFVPEIAALPDKFIHRPFEAPESALSAAGVCLGGNYPAPIVDRKVARENALAAFNSIKN